MYLSYREYEEKEQNHVNHELATKWWNLANILSIERGTTNNKKTQKNNQY